MTDYLLVGNAPTATLAVAAARADVIVQINDCPHAAALPAARNHYIFLTNSGPNVSELVDRLLSRRDYIPHARVVLARNPTFYMIKTWLLRLRRRSLWRDYQLSHTWRKLCGVWPVQKVSFFSTFRLEQKLIAMGMPPRCMPSTGMLAYDWLSRQLHPGDSIAIEGFTFEGWHQHPWQIESQLVRPQKRPFVWEDERATISLIPPYPLSSALVVWCLLVVIFPVVVVVLSVKALLRLALSPFRMSHKG